MRPVRPLLLVAAVAILVAACGGGDGDAGGTGTRLAVAVTDKGCEPDELEAEAGKVSFEVKNDGDEELEFEILDGNRVVDEVENVAPGFRRKFSTDLDAGTYALICGTTKSSRGKLHVTGEKKASRTSPSAGTAVHAALTDYGIAPSPTSVPAGMVRFLAHNEGDEEHEFVVVKTDLAPDALPVKGDEVEEGDIEMIGELEDVKAGQAPVLPLDLKPGKYVLFCNLPEHYQKGMFAGLEVT